MNEWAALDRALDAMAASGSVEVREDGEWLADFATLRWELRGQGMNALVHLWSDGRNLTRRLLRIQEQSEDRIVLEVARFGRAKPGRLEFLRSKAPRPPGRISREQFRARIQRILSECFPDATIGPLTSAPDLKRSLSGLYVRGLMREGSNAWALLAVPPSENSPSIDASLAFGILWLDWMRTRGERCLVQGLRLFVPEGTGRRVRERALALSLRARAEIFEFSEREGRVQKMDSADVGNLESWLIPHSESESVLTAAREAAANSALFRLKALEIKDGIAQRVLPGGNQAAFSFRGLEFARWSVEGLSFGLDSQQRLSKATEPALARMIQQLDHHRNSLATETNHRLYRKAPERWLETLILEDPTRLDAQLDPRFLYSQVPAVSPGDRGILDLLGVTRRGQLVVIELKASEDIQMPIQAVDYWLRVRRHQREGDFQRCGYFSGIELASTPPLVWLVAPALRFHPALDILQKYLSSDIHITRIGLNENWRRGLKVIFRQ
jgi:hypothetical protein